MPTIQVTPSASELLQNVADTLGKAKKVVVVTGAGISTNSGIPDFRSEHGLYSLIQAQFDKARVSDSKTEDEPSNYEEGTERPCKRRRVSRTQETSITSSPPQRPTESNIPELDPEAPTIDLDSSVAIPKTLESQPQSSPGQSGHLEPRTTRSRASSMRPSLLQHGTGLSTASASTADSSLLESDSSTASAASSQTEQSVIVASGLGEADEKIAASTPKKAAQGGLFSSSPLSSPPPVLFDPYETSNESTEGSSDCSDESDSEETNSSLDVLASQTSQGRLRNMKGRDLFDSNIWSDPMKTSVFYRFATTLRQKVKEVEPTSTHHFIARLKDIGKLTRVYTQNIDEIEKKIGLSTDLKVGAGNKRRKSTKLQVQSDPPKDSSEPTESTQSPEDPGGGQDVPTAAPPPEDNDRSKQRNGGNAPDKGVECVFLHGSLHALRCFVCARLSNWDEDDRESQTLMGEQPECPHCAGATAARQEKGKRALGVGKLRPDIVLYGEEHPQSHLISPIVQHDLSANPDLLLVLGTSLRVHGLKVMVREFAKAVHNKGGKVVFINFTKPPESIWGDVIDYWIEWDCDAWVEDLKERKPVLWMSPEAIVEHEKQRREALAEKKRESLANKKRDSMGEKKRDNANSKRRATVQNVETAISPEIQVITEPNTEAVVKPKPEVVAKPKKPPKNPSSDRIDHNCGAYCMGKIAEAFTVLRGEPVDFFDYTPPPKQPGQNLKKTTKEKKTRKSAPAVLTTTSVDEFKIEIKQEEPMRPAVKEYLLSKDRFKKAASTLFHARSSQASQRANELRELGFVGGRATGGDFNVFQFSVGGGLEPVETPSTPQQATLSGRAKKRLTSSKPSTPATPQPSAPICAAVKSNPRVRKPSSKVKANKAATPVPAPQPPRSTGRMPAADDQENVLPPFQSEWVHQSGPRLTVMEPVLNPSPPNSPLDQRPLATLSPNQRQFGLQHLHRPMLLSNPLAKLSFPPRKESIPNPSDQLRDEEAAAAALSGMHAWR
ncbi:hypothetical protein BX600DRAFT_505357 [Xylariales sp. PMI_506]|nr:hypothetical protein BX600DRAFT_505357 [Xylariales sp. PMI_506]